MEKEAHEIGYVDTSDSAVSRPFSRRRDRFITRLAAYLTIVAFIGLLVSWSPISVSDLNFFSCHQGKRYHDGPALVLTDGEEALSMPPLPGTSAVQAAKKVPLEAHIMSKCPDARDCLQQLVVPAMEQISDKVDFKLSFIAEVSNKSTDIQCKHGPGECLGDMLLLCAANLPFPLQGDEVTVNSMSARTPTIRSLGFANCLVGSYSRIPERHHVEQCALEHGIDFGALNACASQENDDPGHGSHEAPLSGLALLRESAIHSSKLGVKTSCTLRLDESVWCVRDGGVWKDCAKNGQGSKVSVLVDEVKHLWNQIN
ncbi:GILT family protein [Aspergillus homomorphus CBS 101889]|uniref:Gamma interferon inducible lysosomal thiol reductase n=1 Tax=Aspergillus homomorphus (strain CBS 101889) TaxID=1450537 RepID=A0A395I440_ASPHC|nr:gamma interferon inducible lysosomal thiol reductase [Aspergillus homomorphus CBS 101889]RAL14971.1 gamma interferon inducible lysosomal thiol reductase [Aspergillus homomorphus CBS 101889]